MVNYSEKYMTEGLSHPLYVRAWTPDEGEVKGLVQLCHGMAEHGARYQKLGEFLAENGYAAFCHDHRGHGKTCLDGETLGYFADEGGWDLLTEDTLALGRIMRNSFPDGSFVLFGHSMGSLVVSDVAMKSSNLYDGFILCGSPSPNNMVGFGMSAAQGFCKAGMAKTPNTILHAMAFADPKKIVNKDNRKNAWLTTDASQVRKYDEDPLCGFRFTSGGFYDMFYGLSRVRSKNWAIKTECKPFLVISGKEDSVGGYGKAVDWIVAELTRVGRTAKGILYPDKRHEILNEVDCDMVYTDILDWIREVPTYE